MKLLDKISYMIGYAKKDTLVLMFVVYFFFLSMLGLDASQFIALLVLTPTVALIVAWFFTFMLSISIDHFSQKFFEWSFFIVMLLFCIFIRSC